MALPFSRAEALNDEDKSRRRAETVTGFALLGCLIAGAVGIIKALDMRTGLDVLLCLLGSTTSFGLVFYIFLGRR